MISRLYTVELRRLFYRRAAKVIGLVVLAVMMLIFVNVFRTAQDLTDEEVRQRQEQFGGIAVPLPEGEPPPDFGEPSEYELFFDDPRFVFAREMPDLLLATGGVMMVAAFAFGATAGGADWSSGSVQALLFWEPRRVRVMLAKVAAVATVALLAALVVQLLTIGFGSLTASARGNFDGVDSQFWEELTGRSLRLGSLAIFTSLLAFGIAGFTRNTGAALGAAFVYFALLENFIRAFRPRLQPYLVGENIDAWIRDGVEMHLPLKRPPFEELYFNSGTRAGVVLAAYLFVVLGVLIATFARRDVT